MSVRLLVSFVCLIFFSSCSACSPGEWATEKLIEKATGISVDEKDGSVTFRSKDGELTVSDKDGEAVLVAKGKDGETLRMGGAEGKLPQGFPLPIADGAKVENSMSKDKGEEKHFVVTLSSPVAATGRIADFYERELERKGLEVERSNFEVDGALSVNMTGRGEGNVSAAVTIFANNEDDKALISLSWEEKPQG